MGRGRTTRAAGAFHAPLSAGASRPPLLTAPSRAPLLTALAAALVLTGCSANGSPAARDASPPAADSPSPQATSDVDLCVRIVGHWARELLDERGYGDYQSMGLSGGQYDILRDVLDAARAARSEEGRDVDALTDRQAREGCVAYYRSGGPAEGPWP